MFSFGPDAGLDAGFVRCAEGTTLLRGHTPGKSPDWFGPAVGAAGSNRFDVPVRDATDVGTCYLAEGMDGVLLERVLRGVWRPFVSRQTLRASHALSRATLTRDLVLLDLVVTVSTVHRLELSDITAPPPYTRTQDLALGWSRTRDALGGIDGILYGSRFGGSALCVALWDTAADALTWGLEEALSADVLLLLAACQRLGLGLEP